MKWWRQCYLKLNSGSVHESSHYHQVEMGLTLRDKWSCVIMCLYQVQAALVLEKVIWAMSLSSLACWPRSVMPAWPHGTVTGKVPFRVVILFIEHQITDAYEMAQFNVTRGYTDFIHITKPHQSSFYGTLYYRFFSTERKDISLAIYFIPSRG